MNLAKTTADGISPDNNVTGSFLTSTSQPTQCIPISNMLYDWTASYGGHVAPEWINMQDSIHKAKLTEP
ncbi:hypothetical protein KOW79_007471 [Hemibagrus wyckioides]|uniref:Uncharacterized protein n=1 Tax=Hemibagrus wyckioides TaxID=337641 RepID=A0A9D3NYN0_9TELE|nr:hypothetical protein KOW79_007471 [Hemibagrus wyckioides]